MTFVGLALATAWFFGSGSTLAGAPKHLYIASRTTSSHPAIQRFRLVKGIPESRPDRVYQGYSGLIAVAGDGTLYVSDAPSTGPYADVIYAFPPGSSKPTRHIDIPNLGPRCGASSGGTTGIDAIAADANGYLFAAVDTCDCGAGDRSGALEEASPATHRLPCNGIAVFSPTARGRIAPVQAIRYPKFNSSFSGLAVDTMDNLYVAKYFMRVDEWSNAITAPQRTRVFDGKYIGYYAGPLATDAVGDVFIFNADSSYTQGWIDRFSSDAKPKGPPNSMITLQVPNDNFVYSIAVTVGDLYAATYNSSSYSVNLYHALRNGPQTPFYVFGPMDVGTIAVGP